MQTIRPSADTTERALSPIPCDPSSTWTLTATSDVQASGSPSGTSNCGSEVRSQASLRLAKPRRPPAFAVKTTTTRPSREKEDCKLAVDNRRITWNEPVGASVSLVAQVIGRQSGLTRVLAVRCCRASPRLGGDLIDPVPGPLHYLGSLLGQQRVL